MPRRKNDGTAPRAPHKRKLTELLVRRQRPASTAYLIWDTKQHGLALRVQPTGQRSFKCIYSRHGRPRWLHLGDANAIAFSAARRLAAKAMLAVAEGQDPAADHRAERNKGTFGDLATRYVDEYAKRHNKSYKQAKSLVTRYLLPRWGKLQAGAISRADVRAAMGRI